MCSATQSRTRSDVWWSGKLHVNTCSGTRSRTRFDVWGMVIDGSNPSWPSCKQHVNMCSPTQSRTRNPSWPSCKLHRYPRGHGTADDQRSQGGNGVQTKHEGHDSGRHEPQGQLRPGAEPERQHRRGGAPTQQVPPHHDDVFDVTSVGQRSSPWPLWRSR